MSEEHEQPTDVTPDEDSYAAAGELEAAEAHYHGRYFPYSGGSAGWFENGGVLKAETGNNYRFYSALDTGQVLQKRFERLGAELSRRRSQRVPAAGVPVNVEWGGQEVEGTIRDFSADGVRVRVAGELALAVGDHVDLRVQPSAFFKTQLARIEAEVVWMAPVHGGETGWHLGLAYRGA